MRFVFITGGVISSLGKGLTAAALGALFKGRGLKVALRKLDPYLNVDPGTLSPYQHGEVFVMQDGTEADLDCGHYERFAGVQTTFADCTTTGQVYQKVLEAERRGDYLGKTVQIVPHITDAIKGFLTHGEEDRDVLIAEIGGTVGDIEGLPFLDAIRQLRQRRPQDVCFVHVGWVPYVKTAGEYKTKPLQHSVRELQRGGIQPDILLLRCDEKLPGDILDKVGLFCNVPASRVVCGTTQKNIYAVPLAYHDEGLDQAVLDFFSLESGKPALDVWQDYRQRFESASQTVVVGVVGKYGSFPDAYRSLYEALEHAGVREGICAQIQWIDPENIPEQFSNTEAVRGSDEPAVDAILVPGGFGVRGLQGTLDMIRWARENKVPYFGICLGMQLAVIEVARNLLGLAKADSSEFSKTPDPVVHTLTSWEKEGAVHDYAGDSRGLGGTMRLGAYPCRVKEGSLAHRIYGKSEFHERHRHRFEVNTAYEDGLEKAGLIFSGKSPCGRLPEIVEHNDHPFFIAVQFHPEFLSEPHAGHPLFRAFVKAAAQCRDQKKESA